MRALLVVAALLCVSARISYTGQQVWRCEVSGPDVIAQLEEHLDVQVLSGGAVDVRVKDTKEQELVKSLATGCEVVIEDLEFETQKFEALNIKARSRADAEWFDAYHTYDEIVAWYSSFAANNSDIITYNGSIGLSANNRAHPAIRIYGRKGATPQYRAYFQCQIHAREWISGATCNYIVDAIVREYKTNSTSVARQILDGLELVVVPFVNPDGYVYTWTNDRQWRKNRRNITGNACIGVDLNRNYNTHFGQGGSSNNSCSDTYMGPNVSSEPETRTTSNYFKSLQTGSPIVAAIDWHSYSQLVLRPWGWTQTNSPDETVLKAAGDKYAADIRAYNATSIYTSQKSIQLYVTTGTASDWFYDTDATTGNGGKRAAGFTIELRPVNNPPGFELPPNQIIPTGAENYVAVKNFLLTFLRSPLNA